jgi:hypothetical protein
MRYQAALRPDWLAHLGRATTQGKVRLEGKWLGDGGKRRRRGWWGAL